MTKPIPGAKTDPASMPAEGHGGDNGRANHTQGKEGNGGQKPQQKRKRD